MKIPVIYVSDLFHPRDDADDNYDLAALYSISNIDILGIVLEQGLKQLQRPGSLTVDQLNYLTNKNVPYEIGLSDPLSSVTDTGLTQADKFQSGVSMILDQLALSPTKVNLVTVGSLRDIAAAYNRNKQLFTDKVDKIMVFAGEATANYQEYNVALDVNAYLSIMRSGLNIWWVPCFDGGLFTNNNGHASFFQVPQQGAMLDGINDKLLQYFIYSIENKVADPITFLTMPVNPDEKTAEFAQIRNIWAANILEALSGSWDHNLYDFSTVNVSFDIYGIPSYNQSDSKTMKRFEVTNLGSYLPGMVSATNTLLKRFPIPITAANHLSPKAYVDNMFNGLMGQAVYPLRNQNY